MRIKFFAVPALDPGDSADEIDRFHASHRIVGHERHLVAEQGIHHWVICVTYTHAETSATVIGAGAAKRAPKVDYREILSESEFSLFSHLRDIRKSLADREGVPPYAVFTNDQLAQIAREKITTVARLAELPGVGTARADKYGPAIAAAVEAASNTPRSGKEAHGKA